MLLTGQFWLRLYFQPELEPEIIYACIRFFSIVMIVIGFFNIESSICFYRSAPLRESFLLNDSLSWYLTRRYGKEAGKILKTRVLPLTLIMGILLLLAGAASELLLYYILNYVS